METIEWNGCYDDSWDGFIVPEAFAHPAKFARGLITRIFVEMLNAGMIRRGDVCVDPFGGIATGGIVAAGLGIRWFGCELEPKFHALGNQNIDLHRKLWEQFGDPVPVLVQGDSRKLRENLRGVLADAITSSPPYNLPMSQDHNGTRGGARGTEPSEGGAFVKYGNTPGQLEGMPMGDVAAVVSSPPYASGTVNKFDCNKPPEVLQRWYESYRSQGGGMSYDKFVDHVQSGRRAGMDDYGSADGQLSNMPMGAIDAVVGSPPFSGSDQPCASQTRAIKDYHAFTRGDGTKRDKVLSGDTPGQLGALPTGSVDSVVTSPPYAESLRGDNSERETAEDSRAKRVTEGGSLGQSCRHSGYGGKGNLGNLPAGEVDGVVTSPPHEGINVADARHLHFDEARRQDSIASKQADGVPQDYGASQGQLGNEQGETFWSAARDIVAECFAILKPGGYAAFVVKAFVRNKQIVDFPGDWRKLCEACGFECVKEVRAMLVKEQRHPDLFGGDDHVKTTERKSFFRRLYEKKYPENSIDYEIVLFFRKPL